MWISEYEYMNFWFSDKLNIWVCEYRMNIFVWIFLFEYFEFEYVNIWIWTYVNIWFFEKLNMSIFEHEYEYVYI